MQPTVAATSRLRFQFDANFLSMRLIAAVFSVVMSMMKSMAINLISDSAGRSPLTQNLDQIESETSSMTLIAVSLKVHGLHYPDGGHGGGRRLLFGQVPLPELLVPGTLQKCRIFVRCDQVSMIGQWWNWAMVELVPMKHPVVDYIG